MSRTGRLQGISWASLAVGLVFGLFLGATAATIADRGGIGRRAEDAGPWTTAQARWVRLPEHTPAGPLPQTFAIPPTAYDYAAISDPLGALLQARPSIMRVDLEVAQGRAGVSLARPDGQSIVSPEHPVEPGGRARVHFALTPQQGPVAVLVRNYDAAGVPGSVTIHGLSYAREDALSPEDVETINKGG